MHAPEGGVFLCVGARVAAISAAIARHVGASGRVVAAQAQGSFGDVMPRAAAAGSLPQLTVVNSADVREMRGREGGGGRGRGEGGCGAMHLGHSTAGWWRVLKAEDAARAAAATSQQLALAELVVAHATPAH